MILEYLLAFVVGLALGWFFVGGLWMTVQKLPTAERPMVLSMSSLLLRLAVSGIGFYLVARGSWRRLVAALIGFVVAKFLLVSRLGRASLEQAQQARRARDERRAAAAPRGDDADEREAPRGES